MIIDLSSDQQKAIKLLLAWFNNKTSAYITIGGYAGTGKTTSLAHLRFKLNAENPKLKVAFCSYTGKATQVLKNKLAQQNQLYKKDFIGTIHSLIYQTIEDSRGVVIGWRTRDREELNYDLIIVDEASMVDEKIWQDMRSFKIPIIAVGDHGQLPPISGNFNLMTKPMLKLEQIHRQAKENPIISLSIMAREKGEIPEGLHGKGVEKVKFAESGYMLEEVFYSFNKETLLLCGYNSTRAKINKAIRTHLGFETEEPSVGDRVICLRNNHEKDIYNGMLGTLEEIEFIDKDKYHIKVLMDSYGEGFIYSGFVSKEQFLSEKTLNNINGAVRTQGLDLFDFGYALTVHKAQGSQAKRVVLFEERFKQMDDDMWKRWLYTAVTRAEEELLIFG